VGLRKGSVEAEPLRRFLNNKVKEIGVSGVAAATGLDPRRVRTICDGYYWAGGKRYEVKGATHLLVDRCVTPFGEHPHEIYGPEWYDSQDKLLPKPPPPLPPRKAPRGRPFTPRQRPRDAA
jgi:hypothetical protein